MEKVARHFGLADEAYRWPKTPLAPLVMLKPTTKDDELDKAGCLNYQAIVGSIIYASIMMRPDIAKAAAVLLYFSHNPGRAYERAAKQCIQYLYSTRFLALQADGSSNQFECFSDAAFADDPNDRKSSQGYLMQLFGLPIHWKAGRQDTVTTSSTEAELLALSSAAKEQQAMARLFKEIELVLEESLQLLCDNLQTIRLLKEETARLHTKLKHVDIHRHWLRQEVQQQRIYLEWVPTREMAADGLTKILTRPKHSRFLDQLGMISLDARMKTLEVQGEPKDNGEGVGAQTDWNVWLA